MKGGWQGRLGDGEGSASHSWKWAASWLHILFILIVSKGLPSLMAGLGNDVVMGGMRYKEIWAADSHFRWNAWLFDFHLPSLDCIYWAGNVGRLTLSDFFFFFLNLGMQLKNRQWLLVPLDKDLLTMHELEFTVGFCRGEATYIRWLAWDELGESSEVWVMGTLNIG